jgi:nitrogen-specific signal transduction histidine kinase
LSHERSAAQAALGAAILDHVLSGIVALSHDGSVSYVNRPAAELLGRGPEECPRLHASQLFGAGAAAEILPQASASPAERRLALDLSRKDGGTLHAGVSVIQPPAGAIDDVGVLVLFRDLDEQRGAEDELRRAEGQAALGRMVAGLSHEIRNPLAAIQGLANVLMAECPEEDPRFEPARRIGELVARMDRLLAACVEAGTPGPAHLETVPAPVLVERALEALPPRWREDGPQVTESAGDLRVLADAAQVVQCLRALVENACEAAGSAAGVRVAVARSAGTRGDRHVHIEVRDAGPGVPPPLLRRIFEPFYSTKPDHLGLGLAVAQALALRNRALLEACSRPGHTVFTLSLPAARRA